MRLYRKGVLRRTGRGVYVLAEAPVTEHHGLAVVARQVRRGVMRLLSALRFHRLTRQEPPEVWIAVDSKANQPRVSWPALRVVRFSAPSLRRCEKMPGQVGDLPHDTGKLLMWRRPPACVADRPNEAGIFSHLLREGAERQLIEGVRVRVFRAAKTLADWFKFRNKIGVDVAIEALRDALRQKKATVGEVYRYAKVCRVARVIRPSSATSRNSLILCEGGSGSF